MDMLGDFSCWRRQVQMKNLFFSSVCLFVQKFSVFPGLSMVRNILERLINGKSGSYRFKLSFGRKSLMGLLGETPEIKA